MLLYPWSRGLFLCGTPRWVPPDGDAGQLEAKRKELEGLLNRSTAQADDAVTHSH